MRHRSSNQIDGYLFETRFPEPPGNHTSLVLPWDEVKLESTLGMVRAEVDLLENLMAYRAIGKQRHELLLERGRLAGQRLHLLAEREAADGASRPRPRCDRWPARPGSRGP